MEIICKRCNYKWNYKGKRTMYACCPNCKTTVKIQMFVRKEKTLLELEQDKYQKLLNKYNSLQNYVEENNPALMEDWVQEQLKEAKIEAEKVIQEMNI